MTLDEAIKHAEEVAEKNKKQASLIYIKEDNPYYEYYVECAEEHRQLAEWLKELKQLREQTTWIPVSERLSDDRNTTPVIVNWHETSPEPWMGKE